MRRRAAKSAADDQRGYSQQGFGASSNKEIDRSVSLQKPRPRQTKQRLKSDNQKYYGRSSQVPRAGIGGQPQQSTSNLALYQQGLQWQRKNKHRQAVALLKRSLKARQAPREKVILALARSEAALGNLKKAIALLDGIKEKKAVAKKATALRRRYARRRRAAEARKKAKKRKNPPARPPSRK